MTFEKLPASIFFVFYLLLLSSTTTHAQVITSFPGQVTDGARNDGLAVRVFQPVNAKPRSLRILITFKAEEGSGERAIEKLAEHMKTVRTALMELGAITGSIVFSSIETNSSSAINNMTGMIGQAQPAWNGPNVGFAVQVQPFPAPQQFAVPIAAPAARNIPNALPRDPSRTIPAIVVATSNVAADWKLDGMPPAEIATTKSKLLAAIAKSNLDGKELFHKFTVEQEDEIFELTKIDIRNGDMRNQFASPVPPPRTHFIGFVPEQDYNVALKSAFQAADKLAKQTAIAGNLKLGKIDSVSIQLNAQPLASSNLGAPPVYSTYSPYPQTISLQEWEPAIQMDDIRINNLNQLQQNLYLSARYKLE